MGRLDDIPHPEITWRTDQELFRDYCDDLNFCNVWTFRSAAIRGDEQVELQRVTLPNAGGLVPKGFKIEKERNYLERNIPLEGVNGSTGLKSINPIYEEVNVPFDYYEYNFRPANLEPLVFEKFKLKWLKDLAKGGFGIAALWQATFEDGFTMKVVIKRPLKQKASAFEDERRWHSRYRGAKNITQSIDLNKIARDHSKPSFKTLVFGKGKYNDPNTIVLEYMEHGSVGKLNHNLAYVGNGVKWTKNALWQLFSGLVRGLGEMAYNNSHFKYGDDLDDFLRTMKNLNPTQREKYWRKLSKAQIVHDVHFDLEEFNVLVGRDPVNGDVTFKLHDFSDYHSHNMKPTWKNWHLEDFWYKRCPVKPGRNLPEQHSTEWDKIPKSRQHAQLKELFTGDEFTGDKARVAGRYGMWSNVFSIGKIVECCITLYIQTHPFQPKTGTIGDEAQPSSYAWRLYDHPELGNTYPNADPHLRKLIAQCMQDDPALRPSLVQLLQEVFAAEEAGLTKYDEETENFWWAATDPKDYHAAHKHVLGKKTYKPYQPKQEQPFSFEKQSPQAHSELDVLKPTKKAAQRFLLSGSSEPSNVSRNMSPRRKHGFGDSGDMSEAQSFVTAPSTQRKDGKKRAPGRVDTDMESDDETSWDFSGPTQDPAGRKRGSKRRAMDLGGNSKFPKKRVTNRGPRDVSSDEDADTRRREAEETYQRLQQRAHELNPIMAGPPQVRWQDHTGLSDALNRQIDLSSSGGSGD